MNTLPLACGLVLAATLQAAVLPIQHLDKKTAQEFDNYVSKWEHGPQAKYLQDKEMWIDAQNPARRAEFEALKPIIECRTESNIPGGHIHHFFGTFRIPNVNLETVLKTVENYSKYPEYFHPDVTRSSAVLQADSTQREQHFRIDMDLNSSTAWVEIALHGGYDAHYTRLDATHLSTTSRSLFVHEYRDAKNLSNGTFPEGSDHGLLWKTFTSWHMRERDGGVDLEVNSFSLTRSVPLGLGWFSAKKARESVEKMVTRTRGAILSNQRHYERAPQVETSIEAKPMSKPGKPDGTGPEA